MTFEDKNKNLREKKELYRQGGGEQYIERQREQGKLLARERIDYLLDPDSFVEVGLLAHAQHPAMTVKSYAARTTRRPSIVP